MTRAEIRNRILLQLNDSIDLPVYWSLDELDQTIQEAQEVLAEEVEAIRRTVYIPRHDGMQFVNLNAVADDVMAIYRLWLPDKEHRIRPITMNMLNREKERFLEDTGDQIDWWYPIGWNACGIYPAITSGDGYIECDYLAWPDPMDDDDNEPEYPDPEQDAMVIYGIYEGLMKQWDVIRAADMFLQFSTRFNDGKYKQEVGRLRSKVWRRMDRQNGFYPNDNI